MLEDFYMYFDQSARGMIKEDLQSIEEIEQHIRAYLCIQGHDDKVEETLQVLIDLNSKHADRVDKLIKQRIQKYNKSPQKSTRLRNDDSKNSI